MASQLFMAIQLTKGGIQQTKVAVKGIEAQVAWRVAQTKWSRRLWIMMDAVVLHRGRDTSSPPLSEVMIGTTLTRNIP